MSDETGTAASSPWSEMSEDQQRRDLDAFRARFEAATGLTADTVRLPGGKLVPFDQLRADPRLYALDVPRWRRPLARWWRSTRRTVRRARMTRTDTR